MKSAAVASALTYATNYGVSMMFLCSTVQSENWLSKLSCTTDGVKIIEVKYLCDECATKKGCQGICVHGELQIPAHIGASSEGDLVKEAMDLVMPGSYQLEVCGSNLHTALQSQAAFDLAKIDAITVIDVANDVDALYVALDPVQAGSGHSGIGLAVVGRHGESFLVSSNNLPFLESNICCNAEKGFFFSLLLLLLLVTTLAWLSEKHLITPNKFPSCSSTGTGGKCSP